MAAKKYVDLTGLTQFLNDLKLKLSANTSESFPVAYAGQAVADGDGATITSTYVKKTLTIAGVDLQDNITKGELLTALNVADGAQVNVVENVGWKQSGASTITWLTPATVGNKAKAVYLDLSGYALKTEIAAALNFKGSETGARLAGATTDGAGSTLKVANGDVYTCTADSSDNPVTFHSGYEYAASVTGTTITWTELGKWIDQSLFVQKTQTVNGKALSGNITLDGSDIALTGYTTTGISGDVAATDTINAAVAKVEVKANANASAIQTLNGDDSTTGSVAKSIKDAIEALDVSQISGDYITAVSEADGKISATAGTKGSVTSGSTGLVDGGAVYTAVEGAKSASAVTLTGSSATAADPTGEGTFTFQQGGGGAQTIDVKAQINRIETISVKGVGASTADAMTITSKAVTIDLNDYLGSVTTDEIDGIFGITR